MKSGGEDDRVKAIRHALESTEILRQGVSGLQLQQGGTDLLKKLAEGQGVVKEVMKHRREAQSSRLKMLRQERQQLEVRTAVLDKEEAALANLSGVQEVTPLVILKSALEDDTRLSLMSPKGVLTEMGAKQTEQDDEEVLAPVVERQGDSLKLQALTSGPPVDLLALALQAHQAPSAAGAANAAREQLVEALKASLPAQQMAVYRSQRLQNVLQARLVDLQGPRVQGTWEKGTPGMRAYYERVKTMVGELVEEIIDRAVYRLSLRPSRSQVAAEVASWRHQRAGALTVVVRHVMEGVVREVVDELVGQVYLESQQIFEEADQFAFGLLVEAVACSQNKFDFHNNDMIMRMRGAAVESPPVGSSGGKQEKLQPPLSFSSPRVVGEPGSFPESLVKENDIYSVRRAFVEGQGPDRRGQGADKRGQSRGEAQEDAKRHYVQGLRAMLMEMRKRRPVGCPFGHTQPLQVQLPPGAHLTKVQRLALASLRCPLAASPSVWAMRGEAGQKLEHGGWPREEHCKVCNIERHHWALAVSYQGIMRESRPPFTALAPPKQLGNITVMKACPAGTFLALGTSLGALLVYDLRRDARAGQPWFQVIGDGDQYQSSWYKRFKPPEAAPIVGLTWSMDSFQLATLDMNSTVRMWILRPAPGTVLSEELDKRAPVCPELVLSLGPLAMMVSGKGPLEEEEHGSRIEDPDVPNKDTRTPSQVPLTRQWPLVFHPSFTITGCQPTLMIPQVTGDLLQVTTTMGHPILPGLAPPASGGFEGVRALNDVLVADHQRMAKPLLSSSTVKFLLPPQVDHQKLAAQSLYRHHQSPIVYCGFLSDQYTCVTVDQAGEVVLWPAGEVQRTGFGWFRPQKRFTMRRTVKTLVPRGRLVAVWPAPPVAAGGGGGWWRRKGTAPSKGPDLEEMQALEEREVERLKEDPQGHFLLEGRTEWLVSYRKDTSGASPKTIRQVVYRMIEGWTRANSLVVSWYDADTDELLLRGKQRCSFSPSPLHVVGAQMTPSRRDLVLIHRLAPLQDITVKENSWRSLMVEVINLEAMRVLLPRIDIWDTISGQSCPAWAVTDVVTALGSEYLLMGLGAGHLGVFSFATGQLVSEVQLGVSTPTSLSHLDAFTITTKHGQCQHGGKLVILTLAQGTSAIYAHHVIIDQGKIPE